MSLLDDFERRLEKVVDGVFSKAFRSEVEPSEIGRRLLREMEGGKSISVSAVYVPNVYRIKLPPGEYERLEGLMPSLRREFIDLLGRNAKERRWRPAGQLSVEFQRDEAQDEGRFEVGALHEPGDEPFQAGPVAELAAEDDPSQTWRLDGPTMTVGRASSCEIVVADGNASRQHARLEARDGEWWIVDLDSTNGTLVNDALVKERRLGSGDRITIGGTVLRFRSDG